MSVGSGGYFGGLPIKKLVTGFCYVRCRKGFYVGIKLKESAFGARKGQNC